ncbi:substrate-binding domain-containing protein [Allorhizocola rhizosphaerae]|uniref:GntR family transcriptional regulator n=1 Tax=Allorhizocola rhizosphaerae TaxID=1872709 RepID=UPI000E3CAC33|nr:substrate-binding domain-containing protein [Allorhizocola rhizosphaerae]
MRSGSDPLVTTPGSSEGVPLYRRIVQELQAAILRNEYVPGKPFISQREVCDRYGVSTATAVRALNEMVNLGILERHRGRGTFVAEQQPKAAAPVERAGAAIACILFGLGSGHVSQMLRGVEARCKELGYRLFLSNSEASAEHELAALHRAKEDGVNGVVLFPVEGSSNALAIEELRQSGIPLVMVDRYLPEIASGVVTADNFGIGYQITAELIGQGHQRIAALWDEIDCTSVRDRFTGHKQALSAHRLPQDSELSVLRSYQKMAPAARRQHLSSLLDSSEPPTALLCAHGYVLATVMQDLREIDPGLLERVALASMDDVAPFDIVPFITAAAALPSKEMGYRAVSLLEETVSAHEHPRARHIVLPIEVRHGRKD